MIETAATTQIHPWVAAGTDRVRFGVTTAIPPDWAATRDFVQTAEDLGFDSFWVPDHPLVLGNATWTTLAAIATATTSLRLGPLVACAAYWNPVILARAAADIDRLSGGRAVLGLGSGDIPLEFTQLGLDWGATAARQARLEETLRIVRPLLRGETAHVAGAYVRAERALLDPPPLQQPYVPILVAGGGERTTLRYVAEYADACNLGAAGWAGGVYTPDDIARKLAVLDERCAEMGRPTQEILRTGLAVAVLGESPEEARARQAAIDPARLAFFGQLPIVGTPEAATTRIQTLVGAGFQYLIFIALDAGTLRLLGERVMPTIAAASSIDRPSRQSA
jgi:alkanesulfonate monooxygenase SsuD/methylene tetrahydromethanopterin reductase-like flavin-dependent oxidoreductase (luciferase family)